MSSWSVHSPTGLAFHVDVAGTASVFAATTSRFCAYLETQTLSCRHSATPGLWHVYAYVNGGGMNLEWFCKTILGERNIAKMNESAEAIPRSDDLMMFVPHLGGRVSPSQPDLRGSWAGLNWSHSRHGLCRAVLEGVALGSNWVRWSSPLVRRLNFVPVDYPVTTAFSAISGAWGQQ